jgi:chromatin remodeling complex protein RSC6
MAGKKNFGGYAEKFGGRTESLEAIMGDKPIGPAEMTKRLWAFIKKHRLATK